ncbi:hypothetical protein MKW94_026978, partial [Papaver nudicaule]|nr:hypothetical protein [Papaver nudicaule]
FIFAVASILLLAGSVLSDRHTMDMMYSTDFCSKGLRPKIFIAGALWSLASVMWGILYYLFTIFSAKETNQIGTPANASNNHGSIAMTQSQAPAQMTLPDPEDPLV